MVWRILITLSFALAGVMVVAPVVIGIAWLFWMDQSWIPLAHAFMLIFFAGIFVLPLLVLMILSDGQKKRG